MNEHVTSLLTKTCVNCVSLDTLLPSHMTRVNPRYIFPSGFTSIAKHLKRCLLAVMDSFFLSWGQKCCRVVYKQRAIHQAAGSGSRPHREQMLNVWQVERPCWKCPPAAGRHPRRPPGLTHTERADGATTEKYTSLQLNDNALKHLQGSMDNEEMGNKTINNAITFYFISFTRYEGQIFVINFVD